MHQGIIPNTADPSPCEQNRMMDCTTVTILVDGNRSICLPIVLEVKRAALLEMDFLVERKYSGLIKSSRNTAARAFNPPDIVLKQKEINLNIFANI